MSRHRQTTQDTHGVAMTAMPQRESGSCYDYDEFEGSYSARGSYTKVAVSNPYTNYKPWSSVTGADTGYCLPSELHSTHGAYGNAMEDIYCNSHEEYYNIPASSASAADASGYEHVQEHHGGRSQGPKPYQVLEPKRPSVVNKCRKSLMPI